MIRIASDSARQNEMSRLLTSGVSVIALCVMSAAAPAYAQTGGPTAAAAQDDGTQSDDQEETIVVTGIRQSLANSQQIKKNADTVVDAITAQDIGALPDRSVTEALQRVPGVSMNRFAGSNDPDHFSVEGSGVVIRGLNYVRSEFNGRDTFSTGVYGQSINFADVPAELLGSVEVYKNLTAEMIEGGLSGTVNLNSRLPFQNNGFHLGVDLEGNYADLAKKWSPTASLLISNSWNTGIGRIGLLADVSYSQVYSHAEGIQITNFQTRDNQYATMSNSTTVQVCRNPLPSDTDTMTLPPAFDTGTGLPACGATGTSGADGYADFAGTRYAPLGGQFRTQDFDRERTGVAFAAQWESVDRRALLTAQFLRSDSTQRWGEHTFESAPDLAEYNTYPYGCRPNGAGAGALPLGSNPTTTTRAQCYVTSPTPPAVDNTRPFQNYVYDADGVFESGYITLPGSGWRSVDSGGTWRTPTGGMQQSLSRREVDDENIVDDYGLNFKFTPDEHWQFNIDGQYVRAQHDTLDVSVFGSTFADNYLDLTGDIPVVEEHKPLWLSATWSGCTPATGMPAGTCSPVARINGENDQQYFADPGNYYWRAAMDHIEHSIGEEWAGKADVAYNFGDDSFLKRIKFGARYADREQNIRYTTYNWGVLSETWGGNGPIWFDNPTLSQGNVSWYSFDNFFRGKTPGPGGGFYYNGSLIEGYRGAEQLFRRVETAANMTGWTSLSTRTGVVAGTDFLPSEIQHVDEKDWEAYLMASFGQDDLFGDVGLSGNIGVRYINTELQSDGIIGIPTQQTLNITDPYATRCAPTPPPPGAPPGTQPGTPGGVCKLGASGYAQLQQFANGATYADSALNKYDYFLPSLNLKLQITDQLLARFAASRSLARPGMADTRDFLTIGVNSSDPSRLAATAGNPYLKPALSDQFDLTLEWYFARVGSLTIDGFYKNIHNFFYQNVVTRTISNNGVDFTIDIRGPANYDGSGKVKGFEVAYQQTYDFLPWIFSGLGLSANYTYIDSQGLPNSRLNNGGVPNNSPIGIAGNLPLEQLSKHNVNVAVFYEKGPVSLRAAYNWRSRFLLTSQDVIFPYYPIFNEATGQLDASAFFSVTKSIRVGVQAVNLLDEITKTTQQFTLDGKYGPRSYFMNDRRYSLIVRASF